MTTDLKRLIRDHRARFRDRYEQGTEPALHPDWCGPCRDCRTALRQLERDEVPRRYYRRDADGRKVYLNRAES